MAFGIACTRCTSREKRISIKAILLFELWLPLVWYLVVLKGLVLRSVLMYILDKNTTRKQFYASCISHALSPCYIPIHLVFLNVKSEQT
jgi:hypothetical protein